MTLWSHEEESSLHRYIVQHQDPSLKIDWSDLHEELPHRNLAECKTKYYRMLRKPTWDFSSRRSKGQSAIRREKRVVDVKVPESDSSFNDQIDMLVRALSLL